MRKDDFMKLEYLDEIFPNVPTKEKEKLKTDQSEKNIHNSEPNSETVRAIEEAYKILNGEIQTKAYKTFEEMWSDICGS